MVQCFHCSSKANVKLSVSLLIYFISFFSIRSSASLSILSIIIVSFLFFVLPSILTHSSIITFSITPDRDTITRLALIKARYERPPCFSVSPSLSSFSLLFFLTSPIIHLFTGPSSSTLDRDANSRLALIKACYERPPCFSASPSLSSLRHYYLSAHYAPAQIAI